MSIIVIGHWTPDGEDVYIPCGFVPDFLFGVNYGNATELFYYWFGAEEEAHETTAGIVDSAGAKTKLVEAAGFNGYNTGVQGPYGINATPAQIAIWVKETTYAVGDYAVATSAGVDEHGLSVDQSQLFQVQSGAGDSGSTEPVWPSAIGETVLDSTPVWVKVTNVATKRGGYQGFLVCDDIQTDSEEWYYMAIKADEVIDHGDVDGWGGGVWGM